MFDDKYWGRLAFMMLYAIKGMREADRILDQREKLPGHQTLELSPGKTEPPTIIDVLIKEVLEK